MTQNNSEEHMDVEREFMNRRSDPVDTKRDISWIPFQDVLCTIQVPSLHGSSGREYEVIATDYLTHSTG